MNAAIEFGRYRLGGVTIARGSNGSNPTWMGFAYGYWFPRIHRHSYGGNGWCVDFVWLCFVASLTRHPS